MPERSDPLDFHLDAESPKDKPLASSISIHSVQELNATELKFTS
uniref:Uncharacterized protein n=1 Tax=Anguilla anguilla TaxID=7936 RepID=A0A0E9RC27_ANGAN